MTVFSFFLFVLLLSTGGRVTEAREHAPVMRREFAVTHHQSHHAQQQLSKNRPHSGPGSVQHKPARHVSSEHRPKAHMDRSKTRHFSDLARSYGLSRMAAIQLHLPPPPISHEVEHYYNEILKLHIAQVLILTIDNKASKNRLKVLMAKLGEIGLSNPDVINGIDAHKFKTEADEEAQHTFPMSDRQKAEWMLTSLDGGPPSHHNHTSAETPSNGALACALGHHHMWELAAKAAPEDPRAWTVILEDDAHVPRFHMKEPVRAILASAPPDVHIVHLDDRHCQYFGGKPGIRDKAMDIHAAGSTAYAVTATGAKLLLAEPFQYGADHWLNAPVRAAKMKALCPEGPPVFTHMYPHASLIGEDGLFEDAGKKHRHKEYTTQLSESHKQKSHKQAQRVKIAEWKKTLHKRLQQSSSSRLSRRKQFQGKPAPRRKSQGRSRGRR